LVKVADKRKRNRTRKRVLAVNVGNVKVDHIEQDDGEEDKRKRDDSCGISVVYCHFFLLKKKEKRKSKLVLEEV